MDELQRAYEVDALRLPNLNPWTVVHTVPPVVDPAQTDPCDHHRQHVVLVAVGDTRTLPCEMTCGFCCELLDESPRAVLHS